MREGLGAVPSNFTAPFNEADESAGPADIRTDKNKPRPATAIMNRQEFFLIKFDFPPSQYQGLLNVEEGSALQNATSDEGRHADNEMIQFTVCMESFFPAECVFDELKVRM